MPNDENFLDDIRMLIAAIPDTNENIKKYVFNIIRNMLAKQFGKSFEHLDWLTQDELNDYTEHMGSIHILVSYWFLKLHTRYNFIDNKDSYSLIFETMLNNSDKIIKLIETQLIHHDLSGSPSSEGEES